VRKSASCSPGVKPRNVIASRTYKNKQKKKKKKKILHFFLIPFQMSCHPGDRVHQAHKFQIDSYI
jgi:hypothetical protein